MRINIYKTLYEGIDWKKNGDGGLSLSVNQDSSDYANKGMNSVDTRVFGKKSDVMFGDGTSDIKTKSLYDYKTSKEDTIKFYKDVIEYIKNGRTGEVTPSANVSPQTIAAVSKWFSEKKSDNFIIYGAKKAITRIEKDENIYSNTFNRVNNAYNNEKVARYMTGTIPGTKVPYIALFSMTDFNFSDAIKHGTIRQNGNTDSLLGISPEERKRTLRTTELANIDVKYDDGIEPDIKNNFSIDDRTKDHDKISYGLNDKKYTSINQFIDKSVQYAAYVLNQENYHPDFIVSPPSSSKFDEYYCTNLSKKLNVPYKKDFFKRNFINVKFDKNRDIEEMRNDGFSEKDIMQFEYQVKNIAYREIAYIISTPIRKLIEDNKDLFSNISLKLHSREKTPLNDVFQSIMIYSYKIIVDHIQSSNDVISKQLLNNFRSRSIKIYNKKYDIDHIIEQVISVIKFKIGFKKFNSVLVETYNLVKKYSDQLKKQGYEIRFDAKKAKLTSFKKQFRPYLHNVYIVADKYLDQQEKLTTQYKNAKFLIFDEDINSGSTMKLCIDALQEKIPENKDKNIMCLVNAYSSSGW